MGLEHVTELQGLHGGAVDGAEGGKTHEEVGHLAVALDGVSKLVVDGDEHVRRAKHELLEGCLSRGIDDRGNARCLAAAQGVEVQHALHGLGLHAIDDGLRVILELHDAGAAACGGRPAGSLRHLHLGCRQLGQGGGHAGRTDEGVAHDGGEVRLRAVDVRRNADLFASATHQGEALGVVGAAAADPDARAACLQCRPKLLEGLDNALEGARNVRKVCHTAADEEDLAMGLRSGGHDTQDGLGVLIHKLLRRVTGVLAVVGELLGKPVLTNRVCVDHAGPAAGDERPDAAAAVEQRELQRGARAAVELVDVGLFGQLWATKGHREAAGAPLLTTQVARSLVQLQQGVRDHIAGAPVASCSGGLASELSHVQRAAEQDQRDLHVVVAEELPHLG
mmetsp:Transcript_72774/g.217255  ORF Transcript_72774/g.217255 Transcript_72774/m.217255 type:complete len:393 (+) Transcript_72774:1652-2830(+)